MWAGVVARAAIDDSGHAGLTHVGGGGGLSGD